MPVNKGGRSFKNPIAKTEKYKPSDKSHRHRLKDGEKKTVKVTSHVRRKA